MQTRTGRSLLLVMLVMILTGCGGKVEPPRCDQSKISPGRIAFAQDHSCVFHVLDTEGRNLQSFSYPEIEPCRPSWSPDGKQILLSSWSEPGGYGDIYVIDADGSSLHRITYGAHVPSPTGIDSVAQWSPDGQQITFTSNRDGNLEVYVVDADGANLRNLSRSPGLDADPRWSPDGRQIAFASDRDGGLNVFLMSADGSDLRRLTLGPHISFAPFWSPDGSKIGFESALEGVKHLFIMALDGLNQRQLTLGDESQLMAVWSPGGRYIAFHGVVNGANDIFVIGADGSPMQNLAPNPGTDYGPVWSADERYIACASRRDSGTALYITEMETLNLCRLTDYVADLRVAPIPINWLP